MSDLQQYMIEDLERKIDEHKHDFKEFCAEFRDWRARQEDKQDERASAAVLVATKVDGLRSEFDSYKRSGKILLGVTAAFGAFAAWVLDIGDALRRMFGKG